MGISSWSVHFAAAPTCSGDMQTWQSMLQRIISTEIMHSVLTWRIEKDGGSAQAREIALEQMAVIDFRLEYELGRASECLRAYKLLLHKYPHRRRQVFDRLRAWSVQYRLLWNTVRRIDQIQMLHGLRLGSLRSWTWSDMQSAE
jgi:hypothetical protein